MLNDDRFNPVRISSLLQKGYVVRTTLRTLSKKEVIVQALTEAGLTDLTNLSFVEADLTSDVGWDGDVTDCTYESHQSKKG